jgi:hypothetical protein
MKAKFFFCENILLIFQDMDLTVGNFTETLSSVDRRIQVMRQFQQLSRGLEARDFNLLMSNINYVNTWYVGWLL